uniref:Kinesin-5-like n=1 Tax=Saccoglossus kowalevskii TaxID=10224 RepID=A0ABM0MSH8_SACKO|nr:PREDICTED: kinesin-5-like [Saccoglossus kowalevskii]
MELKKHHQLHQSMPRRTERRHLIERRPSLGYLPGMPKIMFVIIDDLAVTSQTVREVWLAEQCSAFEQELRTFVPADFVEEFHKKLQQVTKRWNAWNHRAFGVVRSRDQIEELIKWERDIRARGVMDPVMKDGSVINMLIKFQDIYNRFEYLLENFKNGIYKPLLDFFYDDDRRSARRLREIRRDLDKSLLFWKGLLAPGPIDINLFSSNTVELVKNERVKAGNSDFELILRLIPDLHEKAYESLRLARRWRLMQKSSGYNKRSLSLSDAFPSIQIDGVEDDLDSYEPAFSPSQSVTSDETLSSLQSEVRRSESRCTDLRSRIGSERRRSQGLEVELKTTQFNIKHLEQISRKTKRQYRRLKDRYNEEKRNNYSMQMNLDSTRDQLVGADRELENLAKKNKTLKVTLEKQRKKCADLEGELEKSKDKIMGLELEIQDAKRKYFFTKQKLDTQSDSTRLLESQVDALREQSSSAQSMLEVSKARCTSLESQLETREREFRKLKEELIISRSREQRLEMANTHLHDVVNEWPQNASKPITTLQIDKIAGIIGDYWRRLALNLGLSEAEVHNIGSDYRGNMREQKHAMLQLWKQRRGQSATLRSLVATLILIQQQHDADTVRAACKDTTHRSLEGLFGNNQDGQKFNVSI